MAVDGKYQTAAKCCELKRCADRVRSTTDNKDEVLEGKFVTWTLRLPAKRQLNFLLNFFCPLIKVFLTFVSSAKTRVTMRFRAKNAGRHAISGQKRGIQHRVISNVCHLTLVTLWCGRTDRWSRDYYVTTKISWLDRLPNLLSNGTLLARYALGLC